VGLDLLNYLWIHSWRASIVCAIFLGEHVNDAGASGLPEFCAVLTGGLGFDFFLDLTLLISLISLRLLAFDLLLCLTYCEMLCWRIRNEGELIAALGAHSCLGSFT